VAPGTYSWAFHSPDADTVSYHCSMAVYGQDEQGGLTSLPAYGSSGPCTSPVSYTVPSVPSIYPRLLVEVGVRATDAVGNQGSADWASFYVKNTPSVSLTNYENGKTYRLSGGRALVSWHSTVPLQTSACWISGNTESESWCGDGTDGSALVYAGYGANTIGVRGTTVDGKSVAAAVDVTFVQ
jgi:hypothetical protein